MAYDTILLDMDGVLLTGRHTDRSVYRQAAATTVADFGIEYGGDPPPDLVSPDTVADVRAACDDLGLPASPAWACRERAATTIENDLLVAGERTAYPDTESLSALAESATVGVVSNNRHGTVRFAAEHFGWDVDLVRGRFPTLAEFGHLKPDPTFLQWALDRTDSESALYVGDRATDIEAARRAGIDAALLTRDGPRPETTTEPAHYVESLDDLSTLHSP